MFVNSGYRQFADHRPRIVKHCPDIPLLLQAKTSCFTVNMCAWTVEIAFAMPVYPSHCCFLSFYHVHKLFCYSFTPLIALPLRGKWTATCNSFNVVLLAQIRSTCCDGSARYGDELFENTSTLAHIVPCFPFPVESKKYQILICVQSANSPQTRP